ncbi:hypothetical protein AV530_015003 [Patagioenas fasciata monilis]|uniref:Uncharacterized protein n=1 Tax=Patagioenas fasciata monilis TaxID=372326 RepID=A0A1V4K0N7_PATFA|nr:hypothetical protein AV530_015003 [Patagioenas fasciata monilis]
MAGFSVVLVMCWFVVTEVQRWSVPFEVHMPWSGVDEEVIQLLRDHGICMDVTWLFLLRRASASVSFPLCFLLWHLNTSQISKEKEISNQSCYGGHEVEELPR